MNENKVEDIKKDDVVWEKKIEPETIRKVVTRTCLVLSAYVGYKMGYNWSGYKTNEGLKVIFKADPTLKDHMAEAMGKVITERLKKSK